MDLLSLAFAALVSSPGQAPLDTPITSLVDANRTVMQSAPGASAPLPMVTSTGITQNFQADRLGGCLDCGTAAPLRGLFESDRGFEGFINPVSNPVFSKDPRSNSQLRFLFINNNFPDSHPFGGGNAQAYAMQINVALTDRLTFIADKDGYAQLSPKAGKRTEGWLDLAAGLKYTLIRDVENQFLFTAGFMYEIPTGSKKVFQNQGSGMFTPFIAYGKEFAEHWHFMGTHGFSFAVEQDKNSDFFYHSLHLDREIAGWFYPLVELNWFQYTQGGNVLPRVIGEGDGLLNLGTQGMAGRQLLSTAVGAKAKITDSITAGAAYEFGLSNYKGILNNRLTVDLVIRY